MMRIQSGIFCALAATLSFVIACADSGTDDPGGDGSGDEQTQAVCGDGTCAASEVGYCTMDCGNGGNNNSAVCGNGMCETSLGENGATCAADCSGGGGGSGSGSGSGGGGTCPADPTECFLCLLDPSFCMGGLDPTTCQGCLGGGGGSGGGFGDIGCEGGAPDGTCNANAGEDATLCPSDCT